MFLTLEQGITESSCVISILWIHGAQLNCSTAKAEECNTGRAMSFQLFRLNYKLTNGAEIPGLPQGRSEFIPNRAIPDCGGSMGVEN